MTGTTTTSDRSVKRRRVFYIPGYDPMLPRRYRELYRKEGARQAEISGYELVLRGLPTAPRYGWEVSAVIEAKEVTSEFSFLLWSDIVQSSMKRTIARSFLLMARIVWIYLSTGALWRLTKLRKGPVIAALYPVFMLNLQLLLALLAFWLVFQGVLLWLSPWVALVSGCGVFCLVLVWFRAQDHRLYAYYLLHDYSFSARSYGAYPVELEQRMTEFSAEIAAALRDDFDEVLVVGHSSGAHLAISVLGDLLRDHTLPENTPPLGFLSLGHVVPMVSFLPKAWRLRRDLAFLSTSDKLTWIDVTAPGDGCTFALVDPVGVSGVAPEKEQKWPLVISAAFSETLSTDLYKSLKWRFFRLHFQYLCAFDRPRDYDYFQITAGPLTLAERYRGRAPSPSRIATALSPHRAMEAS